MKTKRLKNPQFQSYRNNMALMVLICHGLEQEKAFDEFNEKYQRLNATLIQKEKPIRWSTTDRQLYLDQEFSDKLDKETRDTIHFIIQNMEKDFLSILAKVNLPIHFYEHIWNYLAYGKITAPSLNFALEFHPLDPKADRLKIAEGGTGYISINAYNLLTAEEKALAFKLLDEMAKTAFPKYMQKRFSSKDMNYEIKFLEETAKFRRSKITVEYDGYMKEISKQSQSGKISEKEFKRMERLHPSGVIKRKESSITSKKVAKKFNLKPQNVRAMKSRLRKKTGLYFNSV